jgi:hypothetical protein
MAASSSTDEGRIVFSYSPDGWPQGLLIGYEHDDGFFLEHVIAFPSIEGCSTRSVLARTLRAGIAEAWSRGYRYISVPIHRDHPLATKLVALAYRAGFSQFHADGAYTYFVLYNRS